VPLVAALVIAARSSLGRTIRPRSGR
jgi:hypothetical protein